MPKYLVQANYVAEGVKGLIKEGGSSRRAAIEKLFESVGGKVEAFYYAFGETDLFVIAEIPDHVSAASLSLTVNASGAATTKITVFYLLKKLMRRRKNHLVTARPDSKRFPFVTKIGKVAADQSCEVGGI